MSDRSYNGWKNYETWVVNLWLTNEQYTYEYWMDRAREVYKHKARATPSFSKKEEAVYMIAEDLKDGHEQAMDNMMQDSGMTASLWTDLLTNSLADVDWRAIAQHVVDDAVESETV